MADTEIKRNILGSFWGIGRKVRRWEKEGLITFDQGSSIIDFEKKHQGAKFMRNLAALAVFAIAVGILSIVAANWVYIPGAIKIGAHFLLNAVAAVVMYRAAAKGNEIWREGATFLFFALNLTLIVLIGQVFQLTGNTAMALATWIVISTPAVFVYGHSVLNALVWLLSFLVTVGVVATELLHGASDFTAMMVMLALSLFIPLGIMAVGLSKNCNTLFPAWAETAFRLAVFIFAMGGMAASFLWYADVGRELADMFEDTGSYMAGYSVMAFICLTAPASAWGYALLKGKRFGRESVDRNGLIFVTGSLLSSVAPLLLMAPDIDFLAAVHFVAYWGFAGWIGYRLGYNWLTSVAVKLICLRIIIIYLELFGSLMTTGVGLIGSGILLLLFLRFASNLNKKIGQKNAE